LAYEEMFRTLNTRIHQFAKRQDTWFRGMERRGVTIHWIERADEAALMAIIKKGPGCRDGIRSA
jgi:tRNA A37 N6-isopentenylltransferase MiaA